MAFFAKLHRAEIAPLSDILGVSSEESGLDPEVQSQLDRRAQQLLAEKRAMRSV